MGFFDLFRSKKKETKPQTPLEAERKISRFIEEDELEKAEELAEWALEYFPRSGLILNSYRRIKKLTEQDRFAKLREKLREEPHPIVNARLADLYRETGEIQKAIEMCERGIQKFTGHEANYVVLAKIRLDRFERHLIPKDGELALEYLEKAFRRNRSSYRTLLRLAELYYELSAREHCIEKCEAILQFAPGDDSATELLRRAEDLERGSEDVDDLVDNYVKRRKRETLKLHHTTSHCFLGQLVQDSRDVLEERIQGFRELPGYQSAAVIAPNGKMIVCDREAPIDGDAVARNVAPILSAAFEGGYKLDIGAFQDGVIETPNGLIYLFSFENIQFAVLCDEQARIESVRERVKEFIEHDLYLPI